MCEGDEVEDEEAFEGIPARVDDVKGIEVGGKDEEEEEEDDPKTNNPSLLMVIVSRAMTFLAFGPLRLVQTRDSVIGDLCLVEPNIRMMDKHVLILVGHGWRRAEINANAIDARLSLITRRPERRELDGLFEFTEYLGLPILAKGI
ncbi:hypothetical protein PIB30_071857 [Stylosanthes scabra]|uniref:Uncharacterized protein n=1 Tax=Stylosanthes scabra TaxID=79078 RepID=A0ABU6XME0_9FABA|nr:hypothetical protein [Stylosanthes scabra]